jgi:ABC-type multidrug transport system ATPase subunit
LVEPLLEIKQLNRRFGAHEVIRSLSLDLGHGERVALHGPNGSGKTTVLRCITGTLALSGGEIRVAGLPAGTIAARRLIGVSLSQERSFYLRLSGRTNLMLFAAFRDYGRRDAENLVRQLEDELELSAILAERVDRCSTGMVQQLSFARSLLGNPHLLLLDEPTRSLDEQAVERFWSAIDRRQAAVVIATHRSEDLRRCSRHVELPS